MQIPVEGGYSTPSPPPPQPVSPLDQAEAERIRHDTISRYPSAMIDLLWEKTNKACETRIAETNKACEAKIAETDRACEIRLALAEKKARETEELWEKRRADHDAIMTTYAAIEDRAYQSAHSAVEDKKTIFQLLRTPVNPPKTAGELALKGYKHTLNKVARLLEKDPRMLGGLANLLSGAGENADATAAPTEAPSDASGEPSRTENNTIGALSAKQIVEMAEALPDEILKGRNPADMPLEVLVELVTGYASRSS